MPDKSKLDTKPSISDLSKLSAVDTSASASALGWGKDTVDKLKGRMYDSRKKAFDKKEVARMAKIAEKKAKQIAMEEARAARQAKGDPNENLIGQPRARPSRSARNVSTPQLDNYKSTGNLQADIQGLMGSLMGDLMGTDASTALSIAAMSQSSANSGDNQVGSYGWGSRNINDPRGGVHEKRSGGGYHCSDNTGSWYSNDSCYYGL